MTQDNITILGNITKGLTRMESDFVIAGYKKTYSNAKSWFSYSDKKAHEVAFIAAVNRAAKCKGIV